MYRLPAAALWVLVFAAVLGHFPGLGFDFAGADFLSLARGAGLAEPPPWPAHPWTDPGVWSLWWRTSGADPSIPHTTAVVLVALNALMIAVVGARIGLTRAGAILAASLWLLGPGTSLAVAWTSASAELWALLFGLAGLRLWLGAHSRRDPPLAAVLLVLSVASGSSGLLLAPVCWAAWRWFGPTGEAVPIRRGRSALLLLVLAASALTTFRLLAEPWAPPPGPTGAVASFGSPPAPLVRLGLAAWIWPFAPPAGLASALGVLLSAGALVALALTRSKPAPRLRFALLWTAAVLLPAWMLPTPPGSTGTLAPAAGLAWAVGALLGAPLESGLYRLRLRVRTGDGLVLLALLLVVGPGWGLIRTAALGRTDASGRLADPVLRATTVTAGVRRQIRELMAAPTPPPQIAFLQATRVAIPEPPPVPEGREVLLASPVYAALAGAVGPRLLVAGRATVRWTTLLDEVSPDAFVFLDAGDDRVRPLGPVENARIYAALIAVAAGQYDLARHEFWSAVEMQGAEVRFAFDPDHLPIRPEELDAEATGFAQWLDQEGTPPALRVLRLFASVYESVRGQPLIEEGIGGPLRSGRIDR